MKEYVLNEKSKAPSFNLIVGTHNKKIEVSELKRYKQKIYKYGDIIEIYHYLKPIFVGYKKLDCIGGIEADEEEKIDNRKKVVTRIRNKVKRLIGANFDENSKFITLNFAENITDMDSANYEYMKFIQRLKYYYGDLKYIVVVEFQLRGAIHYHMLYDYEYIEHSKLQKIWGNGFVWINDLLTSNNGRAVDNVGVYIVKYMNKDILDERLMGKKAYFTSKNLKRPEIIYEDLSLRDCFDKYGIDGNHEVFHNSYISKENGKVLYFEYNKKREVY